MQDDCVEQKKKINHNYKVLNATIAEWREFLAFFCGVFFTFMFILCIILIFIGTIELVIIHYQFVLTLTVSRGNVTSNVIIS